MQFFNQICRKIIETLTHLQLCKIGVDYLSRCQVPWSRCLSIHQQFRGGHAFSSFALSLLVPVKNAIFALSLILPTHLTHRYRVSMGGQFNSVTRGMKSGLSISRQKKRVPSSDYLLFGNSLRNVYYLHPCTVQLNLLYVVNDIVMIFRY